MPKTQANGLQPAFLRWGSVAMFAAVGATAIGQTGAGLPLETEGLIGRLLSVLTILAALSLLLERAAEVIISAICGEREIMLATKTRAAEATREAMLDIEKQSLAVLHTPEERIAWLSAADGLNSRLARVAADAAEAAGNLEMDNGSLKVRKQQIASIVLAALGGGMSLAGFRILEAVMTTPVIEALSVSQETNFRLFDIAVTALVLGGGAEGIHKLISRLAKAA